MQSLHAAESDQIQSLDKAVPVVAGVYVNRVESETIEVLRRGDEYWIPVPKLQELVGIRVEFSGQGIQIRTPIGNVTAPMEDSGLYQGEHYLSSGLLKDKTKIQLSFSPSLYAISLIVPWRPGAPLFGESPDKQAKSHPVADVLAPSGALSFLNIENNYLSTFGDSKDMWDYYVESGGRQGEGTWATRFQGDNTDEREHELDLYYWNRVYDRSVLRLGTNYANLNSLLSSQDYTGAQWAYSNTNIQEYTDFEGQTNLDQFIDDDKKLQRDISRGDGPPAGIAELRIDDVPQARVRISLDGQYTFRDVPQVANDFQQVQIYVYRYSLADAPVQILDYTKTTLGRPLEQGEMLLRAGIGETGNPLSDNEEPDDGHFAGFVGARYGISDKVTVQSAIQQNADGDTEIMVGGQMSLGTKWAMAVDSAVRGSALGLVSELQGNGDRWDFNLRLTAKEEGYSTDTSPDTHDVRLRTFLKLSTKLSVGLIGRAAKVESGEKTEFLLPAGYLNLASSLSLSAVPNQDGNYRLSAGYRLTDNTQLTSIYEEDLLSAQLLYKWSDYRDFDFNYLYNEDTDEYTLSGRLNWYPYGTHNERWQTGVSYNGSSTGYQLSWNKIFKPGIELRVDYLDGYNALSDIENERRLFVSLKTDFSRVGGKFVPSNNDAFNFNRGGVAGSIKLDDGRQLDVDEVDVSINGRYLPQEQAGGRFFVGNLKPGVYNVSIDEEHLPIEYVPTKRSYNVEVGGAAVTQVDFIVQAEYGVAGKVSDESGAPIKNQRVEVYNALGQLEAKGWTGQFGYYRIDGLVPGDYTIRTMPVSPVKDVRSIEAQAATKSFVIEDDYLFGIDLILK